MNTGGGPALLGRNWLRRIYLDWKTIGSLRATQTPAAVQKSLSDLLDKYSTVFTEELGKMESVQIKLNMSNQMLSLSFSSLVQFLSPSSQQSMRSSTD